MINWNFWVFTYIQFLFYTVFDCDSTEESPVCHISCREAMPLLSRSRNQVGFICWCCLCYNYWPLSQKLAVTVHWQYITGIETLRIKRYSYHVSQNIMTLVLYSVVCFVFNNVKSLCSLSQAVGCLTSCLDRQGPHWMACHVVNGSLHYALLFRKADFHLWEQDYGSTSEGKLALGWTFCAPLSSSW